jgi:hypothetical protein
MSNLKGGSTGAATAATMAPNQSQGLRIVQVILLVVLVKFFHALLVGSK